MSKTLIVVLALVALVSSGSIGSNNVIKGGENANDVNKGVVPDVPAPPSATLPPVDLPSTPAVTMPTTALPSSPAVPTLPNVDLPSTPAVPDVSTPTTPTAPSLPTTGKPSKHHHKHNKDCKDSVRVKTEDGHIHVC